MIKDNLDNIKKYNNLESNIVKGLHYLADSDFTKIEDGKHIISDDIYVNIQSYNTKLNADFEAHKDYIDIQYMILGEEIIEVSPREECSNLIEYNKEKDIEFLSGVGIPISMIKGDFMILYPKDAHKPSISLNQIPTFVRKAVVKVKQ